ERTLHHGQIQAMMSATIPHTGNKSMESARHLLASLRGRYNQRELPEALGVSVRTVRRWEIGESEPPPYLESAIRQRLLPLATDDDQESDFTFIDLCAGIGGIRKGFERHKGHCVFTSEWDRWAQKTYLANFPESTHTLVGDIKGIDEH